EELRQRQIKKAKKREQERRKYKIVRLQVEWLEKKKHELNERLRATAKHMNHLEHAYHKEEIPLLEKDYE
ncbi:18199_t:CDS:2, partial [Dentiscutata erythropus]